MKMIPVAGPWITQKEIGYVADAAANAWYENANMYHERFEKAFSEYIGTRYSIALPSCTSAIHLALLSLGIGSGDEVIVPDVTWIASAAPVSYVGAEPVFADIDERSWCMSPASFESLITPRTKAVIPVDLYGGLPEMDTLTEIARSRGIAVIEDAAEAIGSAYRGRKAGGLGEVGVFSFHGSKTLTTGEGGMLVTDSEDIYKRCQFLRDHGRVPGDIMFNNREVAFKYKMSSMQAALGLAQLERIEELLAGKRQIFEWYREELALVEGVTLNYEAPDTMNTYWMVTVVLDSALNMKKDVVIRELAGKGVASRPFFHPLSSLPAYGKSDEARLARSRNTVSYRIAPYGVNLPSGFNMDEEKVRYVCACLKSILTSGDKL